MHPHPLAKTRFNAPLRLAEWFAIIRADLFLKAPRQDSEWSKWI